MSQVSKHDSLDLIIHQSLDKPCGAGFRLAINHLLSRFCVVVSIAALLPLFSILYLVFEKGYPLISWSLFTQLSPASGLTGGGIGNALLGTAIMSGLSLLMASPPGILAAIYICEYAPHGFFSDAVRFSAKLLNGIPSIMCGVFSFAVVVLTMKQFSAFAGSVALAVFILPTIILTTEQALLSVPRQYRQASCSLGATPFQSIFRIVLPEAMPGIVTGLMLALVRASGETAAVLFTALFSPYWNVSPTKPIASLSVLIFNNATSPYDYQIQLAWTTSLVLIVLVTFANLIAHSVFSPHK